MENLRNMPFETLVAVVEDYPWFGAAQKSLCEKMSLMGGRDLARDMYASAALQIPARKKIICMLRPEAFSGANILRDYALRGVPTNSGEHVLAEESRPNEGESANEESRPSPVNVEDGNTSSPETAASGVNKNYRGAGDYFSREQYEQVKREERAVAETAIPAGTAAHLGSFNLDRDISLDGFCTEALAEIYAEQGYFERAKDIYAKLILAEPEKNTYFASLIEKLNEKN